MTSEQDIASAVQSLASLFEGKSPVEQKALLAALERAGAAVYRSLAENEPDASAKAELLAAARREEQNAELLERSSWARAPVHLSRVAPARLRRSGVAGRPG